MTDEQALMLMKDIQMKATKFTAELIDTAIEDSNSRSVEVLQKECLDKVSLFFKQNPHLRVKEVFSRIDEQGYGYVSFEEFATGLRKHFKNFREDECDLLAKRYVVEKKNRVSYEKLFEELDLID